MDFDLGMARLRRFVASDEASLSRHADDARIARWTSDRFPHPYTVEDARTFIAKAGESSWAIDVDGVVVGGIGLERRTDIHRCGGEVGYWLAPDYWGRGIASAALNAICTHAFTTLDLVRVQALVFDGNAASVRVLEKCGFTLEGRMRRACIKNDQILDELVFARLRDEVVRV